MVTFLSKWYLYYYRALLVIYHDGIQLQSDTGFFRR